MTIKNYFILFFILFPGNLWAMDESKIERFKWENLEVVYIEDSRFPTYEVSFYFADGTLADGALKGLTESTFDLLKSGTRRFSQKDIADNLEFFGVSSGSRVTHEYSVYHFSGLVRDVVPISKKICHLFSDASYPKGEVKKYQKKKLAGLQSLINSPEGLAERAFREISLQGTPYVSPQGGKIKDIRKLKRTHLERQLAYFNQRVQKRIYLVGPRHLLKIKDIILKECGWKGQGNFVRQVNYKEVERKKTRLVLITVPQSNQAQINVGRFLNHREISNPELLNLASTYLGGHGFASKLMQELRTKRGLTYGAHAFASGQKEYGRAVISTNTKNETIGEALTVIKEVVEKLARQDFPVKELNGMKGKLAGKYPFLFEKTADFLEQVMFLDHVGRSFREFQQYPAKVKALSPEAVAKAIKDIFGWPKQTIVILGSKSLLEQLKAFGKVEVVNYQRYL